MANYVLPALIGFSWNKWNHVKSRHIAASALTRPKELVEMPCHLSCGCCISSHLCLNTACRSPRWWRVLTQGLSAFMFTPTVTEVPNSGVTELAFQKPPFGLWISPSCCVSTVPSVISHHWFHMKTSAFYGQGLYFSLIESLKAL